MIECTGLIPIQATQLKTARSAIRRRRDLLKRRGVGQSAIGYYLVCTYLSDFTKT